MRVQGWIEPLVAAVCSDTPPLNAAGGHIGATGAKKNTGQPDRGRIELLASIRQRIKTGFYNSESVIDDIGHGFAQALDSTV